MLKAFSIFAQTLPDMPAGGWWLAPVVLLLLGAAALIDARTSRVPDSIILPGLLLTTAVQGFFVDWSFAGRHLAIAFAAGFLLYLVNELWCRLRKHDAFGMGDAKWTVLAVVCFDPAPALIAWFIGAWLALGWMGIMCLRRRPIGRVHFAPFLFAGLAAGIYWLRLR